MQGKPMENPITAIKNEVVKLDDATKAYLLNELEILSLKTAVITAREGLRILFTRLIAIDPGNLSAYQAELDGLG